MFVDEAIGGEGYTDAGFTKLFEDKGLNLKGLSRMKPPDLTFQQWISWITNTGKLSPKDQVTTCSHTFIDLSEYSLKTMHHRWCFQKTTLS